MSPSPQPSRLDTPPEPATRAVDTAKGATTELELSRAQQTLARRVAESQATIPQLTLQVEVDLEACLAGRGRAGGPVDGSTAVEQIATTNVAGAADARLACTAEIVSACALALREHPRVNSSYRDGRVQMHSRVNVGVMVSIDAGAETGAPGETGAASDAGAASETDAPSKTGRASDAGEPTCGAEMIAPTVFDADTLTAGEIATQIADLRAHADNGTLAPPQLSGATFTAVDLGEHAIDAFAATVQPGQAAILAVGAARPRPVASDDGQVVVRRTAMLTLSCDHRVLYGADAASFLARICQLLEAPAVL